MTLTKDTQTICDDNGIELLVGFEASYDEQVEYCHGPHDLSGYNVELTSVEIVIAGVGLNIINRLTDRQKDFIISKIEL